MKPVTFILALLLLICTILTACGGTEPTDATHSSVPTTEATEATQMKDIYQTSDPSQDDTLNILMIGNSLCYYYVEELYGMLEAAGIPANVCNIYSSGCTLEKHWTWWKNGESNYEFFVTNENGRVKTEGANLEWCLQQQNWDVISLQESSSKYYNTPDPMLQLETSRTWRTELLDYVKEQFPMAKHYWHQIWSRDVGTTTGGYVTESPEHQQENADRIKEVALAVCKEHNIQRINSGDAWQIVRKEYGYDKLCARIGKGENHEGDRSHDGDWGGGQYLNACVWFEVVTGQSCIGNTYRPKYMTGGLDLSLSEDMIQMLQVSAHKAVAQLKAEQDK